MTQIWRVGSKIIFNRNGLRYQRSGFILLFISFSFYSCTPKMFMDLKDAEGVFAREQIQLFKPGLKESLVYKTIVHFRDREFSSLTYVKALNDSVFKVVLLSTFGNTLIEAEISKEKFTVNNVISYLDRRPILKLFENDWRLLLEGNLSGIPPKLFSQSQEEIVFEYGKGRTHHLFHYS